MDCEQTGPLSVARVSKLAHRIGAPSWRAELSSCGTAEARARLPHPRPRAALRLLFLGGRRVDPSALVSGDDPEMR